MMSDFEPIYFLVRSRKNDGADDADDADEDDNEGEEKLSLFFLKLHHSTSACASKELTRNKDRGRSGKESKRARNRRRDLLVVVVVSGLCVVCARLLIYFCSE